MKKAFSRIFLYGSAMCVLAVSVSLGQPSPGTPAARSTLGLESGFLDLDAGGFKMKLVKSSQTLAALEPKNASGFDFTPADRLEVRSTDGFYHFGDIRFRIKNEDGAWREFSTAASRKPIRALAVHAPDLAKADLTPTLPEDCPIRVLRTWTVRAGKVTLHFEFENKTDRPIEVGYIGIPLIFNNILTDRSLAEAHEKCSFSDPYIGMDAGYVQVTRLKGTGPALVVVPLENTPFEAYQLLKEPMRPQQTFEGMFEWVVRGKALAETEWGKAQSWNVPAGEMLKPRGKRELGLAFLLSEDIRSIEKTLAGNGRPVTVGIPGYVLPNDVEGKLFLKYGSGVKNFSVEPANALKIEHIASNAKAIHAYSLKGSGWGRARVTVDYADGTRQTIQYYLTKPASSAVDDLGKFLTTRQWFENGSDPFKRSPSVMTYDRELDKIVEQDNRVWIAGLGDEGGSGSWVAAAMKEFVRPNAEEIAKYERFIDGVLWGGIQYKSGENKYGVRKSMLYYAPETLPKFPYGKNFNWTTWASWKKDQAESIGRGYNYPHVVAAYWVLYRTARNTEGLVKSHSWDWYLDQAYQTTKFAFGRTPDGKRRVEYVELGLMEGTIFFELLNDLKREGWTEKANVIEKLMKERADAWSREAYPFGSEMAWDSTGQEEVYAWCKYFGYEDKAAVSLNSIIGYMPSIPHWGYNGNARRYWDFLYAAKLRRIERQIHHYGSGLNAIPMLDHFRSHPDDLYTLRVGYAGGNAALSNIDQEGFASAAFHSYPDTLKWDAYSGDYGMNFFGYAINAATYVVNHKGFGWLAFGGNIISNKSGIVTIMPRDSMRRRIYIAPLGLWLTLDSGTFSAVEISLTRRSVTAYFDEGPQGSVARLRIGQPAKIADIGTFTPANELRVERGAYIVMTDRSESGVRIVAKK